MGIKFLYPLKKTVEEIHFASVGEVFPGELPVDTVHLCAQMNLATILCLIHLNDEGIRTKLDHMSMISLSCLKP